jgi:hypothetical protein
MLVSCVALGKAREENKKIRVALTGERTQSARSRIALLFVSCVALKARDDLTREKKKNFCLKFLLCLMTCVTAAPVLFREPRLFCAPLAAVAPEYVFEACCSYFPYEPAMVSIFD